MRMSSEAVVFSLLPLALTITHNSRRAVAAMMERPRFNSPPVEGCPQGGVVAGVARLRTTPSGCACHPSTEGNFRFRRHRTPRAAERG